MSSQEEFHGPNVGYILELYERYRTSPESLDPDTRQFFQHWTPPELAPGSNGAALVGEIAATSAVDTAKIVGAVSFAQAVRLFGHLGAHLDPLGSAPIGDPELNPEAHGITWDDLRSLPASLVGGPVGEQHHSAYDAIQALRAIYSSSIGFDNDHIRIPEERNWLRDAIESRRFAVSRTDEEVGRALLDRLTQVEVFEHFLQRSFPTKYRFSIEGLDMMVPMLDEIVHASVDTGVKSVKVAMAHRGRLNVLAHIMHKPYEKILADFKDPVKLQELQDAIGWTIGDVKYHKGVQRRLGSNEPIYPDVLITMPPNPSHLEAVNPVAVGMARAAGTHANLPGEPVFDPATTMQILIHGDAAFPAQGIVAETFNLSRLPGYWTGGTIHIIANNQLGFTTLPSEGRSTIYASDLAKGFKVPIVHVSADDPEACIEVARMAFAYQELFEKDFLIDLVGYRRYGHNELDEPGFTQPLLYERVRKHPTARQIWASTLANRGWTTQEDADALVTRYEETMQATNEAERPDEHLVDPKPTQPPAGAAKAIDTAVVADNLLAINEGLRAALDGFTFYNSRLRKAIQARRDGLDDPDARAIDWATAEELAFASILADGIPIRLTGQDSERGTFSHRHAVLYDKETGQKWAPLQRFSQARAGFEVRNSPLSEEAVLAFEFGYNVQEPGRLTIWEAQYGDFSNGAQNIIDEFVLSAREKWGQTPSLVMLLPHGHEGAGPDHSSARPERFLQLAAKINLRLANCTTAAQYFHLLRRQALLLESDPLPLIVMSPKSLLRNANVASSLNDLANGRWQPIIDDDRVDPKEVTRLVFVSGKFYYDLLGSEFRDQHPHVALVRVEQLYPFAAEAFETLRKRYKKVKQIVWAQEEPKNMGAWEFMNYRLRRLYGTKVPINYVGRRRSSSPAEGSRTAHNVNQAMITEYAFNWEFNQ
ncbi:MAG: 2-oxoglutarate dehydrogenase E1 component [Chloroflexi bacterium]|nr:2-oxoglutarate dehydrogenase E1 component [Chloroflexota bacterium]